MTELTDIAALEACLHASTVAPVMIFKHSTSCPISAGAHGEVTAFLGQRREGAPEFYIVKVIESRPVSNEIASRLGIAHKSPQLIMVKDGQPLWSASHYGINVGAISAAIDSHVT